MASLTLAGMSATLHYKVTSWASFERVTRTIHFESGPWEPTQASMCFNSPRFFLNLLLSSFIPQRTCFAWDHQHFHLTDFHTPILLTKPISTVPFTHVFIIELWQHNQWWWHSSWISSTQWMLCYSLVMKILLLISQISTSTSVIRKTTNQTPYARTVPMLLLQTRIMGYTEAQTNHIKAPIGSMEQKLGVTCLVSM